ncbi:MAG: MXAN_2562 family outer membrane beta-barrel protein [Myxococcota bacterium]|nr:MXAN_2562 family outer membrane beta-barrel protein [Myxococcota bacterium]
MLVSIYLVAMLVNVTERDVTQEVGIDITWDYTSFSHLSKTSCDEANSGSAISVDIAIDNSNTLVTLTQPVDLYVHWASSSTDCKQIPEKSDTNDENKLDLLIHQKSLTADDPPFSATDTKLTFPTDLSDDIRSSSVAFTVQTVLDRMAAYHNNSNDVCAEDSSLSQKSLYLCFGFNSITSVNAVLNNDTSSQIIIEPTTEPNGYIKFEFDSNAPAKPSVSTSSFDGGVSLSVSIVNDEYDLQKWEVLVVAADSESDQEDCSTWINVNSPMVEYATTESVSTQTIRVSNLQNGTDYLACLRAVDHAGNASSYSDVVSFKPTDECDFGECYPGELETGYCGQLPPSNYWVLFIIMGLTFVCMRRRLPNHSFLIPLLLLTLISMTPSASEAGANDHPTSRFEIRFSPYNPTISGTQENRDFYDLIYHSYEESRPFGNNPVMVSLSENWFFHRFYGLLGVGFELGYWTIGGQTRQCRDSQSQQIVTCERGNTRAANSEKGATPTSFTVVPISVDFIYRFDYLEREFGFPVHLYTKLGMDYYLWWSKTAGYVDTFPQTDGSTQLGQGGVLGYHANLGVSLNLDTIFGPTGSAGMVQLSNSLFFEIQTSQVNQFGKNKSIDLSSNRYIFGLGFDFR